MGYEAALQKAWDNLRSAGCAERFSVRFLSDTYELDTARAAILSSSCNIPAKDFYAILILHYCAARSRGLPQASGRWLDFREISGLEGYEGAFRKRCIEPVLRKYGKSPQGLVLSGQRLGGIRSSESDAAVVIPAFEGVPVLVTLWQGDEDFPPDGNMLFDASIRQIFCTEDVAVLGQIVAAAL